MSQKIWIGTVVSDKPDKTVVVMVTRQALHPLYHKRYNVSKKFMVHDETNQARPGDRVSFVESRPLSARKRHTLHKVIQKASAIDNVAPDQEAGKII